MGLKSLNSERVRTSFMVFYVLSSLIPILILMYIISQYVRPHLSPGQIEELMDPVTYGLIAMLFIPFLGIVLMSLWIRSLERLTADVKSKSADVLSNPLDVKSNNEIVFLRQHVDGLYGELKGKISQLNEQSRKLTETEKQISRMAAIDDLTGVMKRRLFDGKLMEQIKRAERGKYNLALLLIDIREFRKYNQAFGHGSGDEVLRTVGKLLKKHFTRVGIPFRYGGDEFAVILPRKTIEEAAAAAQKLLQDGSAVRVKSRASGKPAFLTLNCAVISYDKSFKGLFMEADRCLGEANSAGNGNVVCLTPAYKDKS